MIWAAGEKAHEDSGPTYNGLQPPRAVIKYRTGISGLRLGKGNHAMYFGMHCQNGVLFERDYCQGTAQRNSMALGGFQTSPHLAGKVVAVRHVEVTRVQARPEAHLTAASTTVGAGAARRRPHEETVCDEDSLVYSIVIE
jgi:hypothetical protein